jgi:HEAT repeat protein
MKLDVGVCVQHCITDCLLLVMEPIFKLLEQTKHHDKDERYMAISDLKEKLEASANIDPKHQQAIRDAIITRLKDESSDVQAMAVNCLGAIVQKFSKDLVVDMVTELGNLAVSDSAGAAKDNYSQGIRTIIKALPKEFAAPTAQKLAPIMLKGIANNSANIDHRIAHLVIIGDLLRSYGKEFTSLHKDLLSCFVQLLEHPKSPLRKEVSLAVGMFSHPALPFFTHVFATSKVLLLTLLKKQNLNHS